MTDLSSHPDRPKLMRLIMARPRLFICALLGVATALLLPSSLALHRITELIIAWNVGACCYLLFSARMMFWSTHESMQARALQQDEGRILVLVLVVTAAIMCLGAILAELVVAKDLHGTLRYTPSPWPP